MKKMKTNSLLMTSFAITLATTSSASAQTLGDLITNISNQTNAVEIVSFLAFLTGIIFTAFGVYKLRQHVEFGPQSVQLPEPLKYLFTGGLMMTLPMLYIVAANTFNSGAQGGAGQNIGYWFTNTSSTGDGLDQMLQNFINDIYWPTNILISFFCYTAGAVLLMVAVHRFTKTAQEGPRGPTGLGTIATFMLAGALFSIAPMVGMFTETLFGDRTSRTLVAFMSFGDGADMTQASNVFTAILAFLIIVGIISIVRGFFVLRDVAEGAQQATMMSGLSHVIAGAILVNFGQFANLIQNTLGIADIGVQFL